MTPKWLLPLKPWAVPGLTCSNYQRLKISPLVGSNSLISPSPALPSQDRFRQPPCTKQSSNLQFLESAEDLFAVNGWIHANKTGSQDPLWINDKGVPLAKRRDPRAIQLANRATWIR